MAKELKTLDDRVNWLAEELLLAKEQMAGLLCRIEALEQGKATPAVSAVPTSSGHTDSSFVVDTPHPLVIEEDSSWAHIGQAVLLPRLAAVSFMLVAALILRTITDNGMVGLLTGSVLGMAYAVALIAGGVVLYGRQSRLAPVFPTCGVLLLYAIIFETQSHFSSLSGQTGYLILLLAESAVIVVGLHCRDRVLLGISVFASTLVGIAIGFPTPMFVLLSLVILVNNLAAHLAARRQISHSLKWYTLIFSTIFWMLWAYKLNFALKFAPAEVKALGLPFFLPLAFVFWAFYTYTSLWKTLCSGRPLGVFHHVLPAVAAGGGFFAANAVLHPWGVNQTMIGMGTVALSALYLGLVAWLARRGEDGIPGGKEFVTAAVILLIQGLAISVPPLATLPVWTMAAAILTLRADRWQSGGIRLISYLFQVFVLFFAFRHHSLSVTETAWPLGMLVAGLMAGCNLWLYRWCRRHPPDYDSAFFTVFDKGDYSAGILLVLGLFQAFAAVSFAASALLPESVAQSAKAFACVQSVIVNAGIVALLILGLQRRSRELLTVAGVVVLVAAIKVFLFDLLRANGLPLVFSVFSFGVVAATSSVVMRKWQGASEG